MAVFPSVEWFNAVRERYNSDAALHTGGGGPCEAKAALCIGANVYLLEFDGFECAEVKEIGRADVDQADFCLDMPASEWVDMVENIQENGAADLHHTLSTIDLELEDGPRPRTGRRPVQAGSVLPLQPEFPRLLRCFGRRPNNGRRDRVTGRDVQLSIERLKSAQSVVNASDAFRDLGSVDVTVAMESGEAAFLATFRAFGCGEVREIDRAETRDGDFVIEMTPGEWRDYLAARRSGVGKSLAELDLESGIVRAANPRKKQDFFRYHQSLQLFIDALVGIPPSSRRGGRPTY